MCHVCFRGKKRKTKFNREKHKEEHEVTWNPIAQEEPLPLSSAHPSGFPPSLGFLSWGKG